MIKSFISEQIATVVLFWYVRVAFSQIFSSEDLYAIKYFETSWFVRYKAADSRGVVKFSDCDRSDKRLSNHIFEALSAIYIECTDCLFDLAHEYSLRLYECCRTSSESSA